MQPDHTSEDADLEWRPPEHLHEAFYGVTQRGLGGGIRIVDDTVPQQVLLGNPSSVHHRPYGAPLPRVVFKEPGAIICLPAAALLLVLRAL